MSNVLSTFTGVIEMVDDMSLEKAIYIFYNLVLSSTFSYFCY